MNLGHGPLSTAGLIMANMRRHLPSGAVTFLFTDIEGSTKLVRNLGDAYPEALTKYRRLLRDAFGDQGGVEVDAQGDAFFYAFAEASQAVRAAQAGQVALMEGPIRVRMGMHTGEGRVVGEGYVGTDVHRAARIAACANGGQVVLSRETRSRLGDAPDLLDLGEHRLKDFSEPVWIYQLGAEQFPPLRTISNTNLPRPASSFVGRDKEVGEVATILQKRTRLVTLTGPGGSGKTRLAIEAAALLITQFRNGVFWVSLAALRDPALVTETIALTLGAKDGLAEYLRERHALLVLDNFEQVVGAGPGISSLLAACPNLRLLVTSRELLRIQGEVEYAVPPLAEADAVELFCTRAQLEPSDHIAELCRRLDSLPLAVELAAARVSVLSPRQILEHLSQRLDLLTGGRDAQARQQTLRATIDWSYDLLNVVEKRLFARLSVFAGGCTLEAAEHVAEADLDTLQSLVDKSLSRHTEERFWMLETIREYATERLEKSGESSDLRRRHANHFLALAEMAEPSLLKLEVGEDSRRAGGEWLDRLERELDNLRGALDWLEASRDWQLALRLAGAMSEFWSEGEHVPEGRHRLESALQWDERPTAARAKALNAAAHMARVTGDASAARLRADEALQLHRTLGDGRGTAYSLLWLGQAVADEGDFAQARQLFDECARGFTELGDEHHALVATRFVAWMFNELGDREGARALHEDNLRRARGLHNESIEATTLGALALYAVDAGRVEDAVELATESLRIFSKLGDRQGIAVELCRCAGALALAGEAANATRLLARSEALYEEMGTRVLGYLAAVNKKTRDAIRTQIDEDSFAKISMQGRTLTVDEAVALALGSGRTAASRRAGR